MLQVHQAADYSMEPPESSSTLEEHELTKEEKEGVLYGVVTYTSTNKDTLILMAKGSKFLLTKWARRHSGRQPKVSDLVKFYAKPAYEDGSDVDGLVGSYMVFDPLPPSFRTQLHMNKEGREVVMISCELIFDRNNPLGEGDINMFYNQWIGSVFDLNRVIESPLHDEPYQCCVMRRRRFDGEPHGIWFIVYVQYMPKSLLMGPFKGFLLFDPKCVKRSVWIWCREVAELKHVAQDLIFAFGFENVGTWVRFWVDKSEKVWRLEKIEDGELKTKVTDDKRNMSTLPCEFRGQMRDGHPVWYSDMAEEVLDPHNISHPKEGDRRVFWCVLECREKGNEVWEMEAEVMERRQRVEGNERTQRNERGYNGVENKDRAHSLHSDSNNCVEEEPTLSSICKKLFGYSEVRRVTRDANPLLYAQLMERLNGYGSG